MAADDIEGDMNCHHANERVIHRGKDSKGLPSSFTSSISQRISPTRLPSSITHNTPTSRTTTTKDGRSVRSIVAWLESAATNADTSRDDLKSVHSVATISSAGSNSSLLSRHTIPGAEDVEEYSLTLLKYKQYYTEVPLGRCLDEQRGGDQGVAANDVPGGNVNASTEFSTCLASVYAQGLALVDEQLKSMSVAGVQGDCGAEEVQLFHRDCEEVMAF